MGDDYTAPTSPAFTLSWSGSDPDGTVKSITIQIANDNDNEANETVNLQLANATGSLTLGTVTTATLSILDDDAPTGVLLNEISVDPPTATDIPNEWVELIGTPGTTLNNLYLVYLPGDNSPVALTASVGRATKVVDLTGTTIPANGLLYVSSPGGIAKQDLGTLDVSTPAGSSASANQSFFNGTGSFLLYWSPTAIVQGTDYVTNNDGSLDTFPVGTTLDSLGFLDGDFGDRIYVDEAAILFESGTYVFTVNESVDAATRTVDAVSMSDSAGWYYGNIDGLTATSLTYGSIASASTPFGASLTPGAANSTGSLGGVLQIDNATYSVDEAGAPTLTINVTRTGGTGAIGVSFAAGGGTATSGADYSVTTISPLSWADGDFDPKQIVIPITNDTLNEGSENFTVSLSAATGAAVMGTNNQAVVTINDDDTAAVAVLINELDVAPPGADNPFEYIEIKGAPGTGLGNVYFVGVEGDNNTLLGQANFVHNLSGFFLGSNGLAVIKASTGGFTLPAETTFIPDT